MACDAPLPLETDPLDPLDVLDEDEDEEEDEEEEVPDDVDDVEVLADGTTAATTSAPARLATTRPPVTMTTWR